jgi:hypothetical protein
MSRRLVASDRPGHFVPLGAKALDRAIAGAGGAAPAAALPGARRRGHRVVRGATRADGVEPPARRRPQAARRRDRRRRPPVPRTRRLPGGKGLAQWARAALVHGAAGEAAHYELALVAAHGCRRVLIIETDSAHVAAWCRALGDGRRMPLLCIVPPDGRAHPTPPARGTLQ